MSWDPVWEKIFQQRDAWGNYPPEELVRFIAQRYFRVPDRRQVRIMEVGCGPGGGPSWFIAREGFSFTGVDGSETAIGKARQRFSVENLTGEFHVGSLDKLPWGDETFDCIVDVACLQCNNEAGTERIVSEIRRLLKPGGNHFSLTARAGTWGDRTGERIDSTSFRNVTEGPFAGMGVMRFATRESIEEMYAAFSTVTLEYSLRSLENGTRELGNWVVSCRK
jgi:SAM-dependent methyltransferase